MATSIYLGMPPPKIKEWIEKNYVKPIVFKDETQVTYIDGTTWEGLIDGELERQIPNKTNIKEVILGNKVTNINPDAFDGCVSLTSVYNIHNAIVWIGFRAFRFCKSLISLNIPSTTSISRDALCGCISLTALPNQTTAQVEQWFNEGVFGDSYQVISTPYNLTLKCKDGIIYANSVWNDEFGYITGWNITITPF